ncbi:CHCH domain-containing protein [Colletotrichum plurivorum]|uniref:CHCH domain-containing protein n=1 Tax=Colletotrichum plurivorum TaxID=2175906 RepID=A0A8H6NQB4_9PEZI|nr:CHCH domain-containing protein [Colletotrichum plurivorum]
MPRQRSVGRAPSRPTVPAAKPAPAQTRPATTMAAPPQHAAPPAAAAPPVAAAPAGPGLMGQMASTAAYVPPLRSSLSRPVPSSGVAIGSSIGHAIGGLFSGGSSSEAAAPAQNNSPVAASSDSSMTQQWGNNCAGATQQFTKCMDEHSGNMQICNWYLEQLKACQAAASQY